MNDSLSIRLFRCDVCHTVQAVVVNANEDLMCFQTCACGNRFNWTQIKTVN